MLSRCRGNHSYLRPRNRKDCRRPVSDATRVKPHIRLINDIGIARANIAASVQCPMGTKKDDWDTQHQRDTVRPLHQRHRHAPAGTANTKLQVLQQHTLFFDPDADGIIWPLDTYRGFRALEFNILLSIIATLFINGGLSYPSVPGILPDPFFRIWVQNIHKCKHGSDTGTYDTEGRFLPQKFEDVFSKYGTKGAEEGITFRQALSAWQGQRLAMDPFGWTAEFLECEFFGWCDRFRDVMLILVCQGLRLTSSSGLQTVLCGRKISDVSMTEVCSLKWHRSGRMRRKRRRGSETR